jgi:hypothetical protein
MALILHKQVVFDGEPYTVVLKFNHWLPKMLKIGGIAIGRNSYYPRMPEKTAIVVAAHELLHNYDFFKRAKKVPGGYFFDVIADKFVYLFDWIKAGFSYRKHKEEVWAYSNDDEAVLKGTYPGISAPWLEILHKNGLQAFLPIPSVRIK